jgi:hypothetical protein
VNRNFFVKLAVILHIGSPGPRELGLSRILDFFGVAWKSIDVSKPANTDQHSSEYAVFGSIQAVAAALSPRQTNASISQPFAIYAYADEERGLCEQALSSFLGKTKVSVEEAPSDELSIEVSRVPADLTGPMAGVKFLSRLGSKDSVLIGVPASEESNFATVISAGEAAIFIRFEHEGVPVLFCASSEMVDIDQPVGPGYYDVKAQFCCVVPLVMFIQFAFRDVAWGPRELGACLIIDDPLLKLQYGFCDFKKLRDLMLENGFTTNIAFIPWNWRRTSAAAGEFFGNEPGRFSISIHGCDHTASEFGTTSPEGLHYRAQLARSRMRNHQARTGIKHDSIMVFPQGVFSSVCPEVLKSNGYLAAVNTETVPVDLQESRTRIRDVWDVAIMSYGAFPIFTRRYAFHGLENFAFDLLVGKPCLIVAHHDIFKDGGNRLLDLIQRIGALNCSLHWRPLGDVIRRACRTRSLGANTTDVEMYGNELVLGNSSDEVLYVSVQKRRSNFEAVSKILSNEEPMKWTSDAARLFFNDRIDPGCEKRFRIAYQTQGQISNVRRSLRLEASVALRRMFCELRDDYLARNRFLGGTADTLNSLFRKAI